MSAGAGDAVYAIPTIQAMGGGDLILDIPRPLFDYIAPLLRVQPCLKRVMHYNDCNVPVGAVDLNKFWGHSNLQYKNLTDLIAEMQGIKLEQNVKENGWLENSNKANIKYKYAIINKTHRYSDKLFNWKNEIKFLKKEGCDIVFMGLYEEYIAFIKKYGSCCEYCEVSDALQASYVVKYAKYFSSNESSMLAIRKGFGLSTRIEQSPNSNHCRFNTSHETIINKSTRKLHYTLVSLKRIVKMLLTGDASLGVK